MKIPLLPVKIDDFCAEQGVRCFLLSHFHTDHLGGLTPSWDYGTIYCTAVTRQLVLKKFCLPPSRVVAIPYNTPQNVPMTEHNHCVEVLAIDANHIPGSAMFVLRHSSVGSVLYSGDFRYAPAAMDAALLPRSIDHLFVDDTWLHLNNSTSKKFLSDGQLDECFASLAATVDTFPAVLPRRCVVRVYLHNKFGKEALLQRLALRLGTSILVSDQRFELLECIAHVDPSQVDLGLFVPESRLAKISIVEKKFDDGEVVAEAVGPAGSFPMIEVVSTRAEIDPTALRKLADEIGIPHIAVIMSGWAKLRKADAQDALVFEIPYTLHNSPQQLEAFVERLRPGSICSLHTRPSRSSVLMDRLGRHLRTPNENQTICASGAALQDTAMMSTLEAMYRANTSRPHSEHHTTRHMGIKIKRHSMEEVETCEKDNEEDTGPSVPPNRNVLIEPTGPTMKKPPSSLAELLDLVE